VLPEPKIIGLFGPTCVGKTAVSISLAGELDAEIISVDSRQIYREITVGAAKPSAAELAAVPHYFINERSVTDPITAGQFAQEASRRVAEITSRGRSVLFVGGSTLYLHALLFGLDDVPQTDPEVRARLRKQLEIAGLPSLVLELARVDPETHSQIDLSNPRRVLRALEVFETTGKPISFFQSSTRTPVIDARIVVMNRERQDLYRRINARVETMMTEGLVDEVNGLLEKGYSSALQALQTIGYREVAEFLSGGTDRSIMVEAVKRNTRRYAKRQLTWFRRYPAFEWIEVREDDAPSIVTTKLLKGILRTGEG